YSLFDYIVGTRFHSVIFSLSNSIPGIAISYAGNKSYGIMHDIGLDEYVIDIREVSYNLLKEKFDSLINNEIDVKNKIKIYNNKSKKLRNDLIIKIEKVAELYG
ncbi:MAG: polysaccharide pyruvyl transferase family protein, partial [bacterium]